MDRADRIAHAVDRDHLARDLRRPLNIVGGAAGNIAEHDFLRRAAAEQHRDILLQLILINAVLILNRRIERITKCAAGRNNRDLTHRVLRRQRIRENRVSRLVISGLALFLRFDLIIALLSAHRDFDKRFFDIDHADERLVFPRRKKSGLVEQVCKVRAGKADRRLRDLFEIHIVFKRLALRVHLQNVLSALDVGIVHRNLSVKSSRTQKRRIENVGTVGRGNHDDAVMSAEAVHLHKQLIERLFPFVMSAAESRAAATADRIDLIDKDDARGRFLRRFKQVAHAGSADADVHLDEIRTGYREKRNVRLAGSRLCKQRFTRSGRAYQQNAARDLRAELAIFCRIAQIFDDLPQLLFFLVRTGDIAEIYPCFVSIRDLDARPAEGGHLAFPIGQLICHIEPKRHADHENDQIRKQGDDPRSLLRRLQITVFDDKGSFLRGKRELRVDVNIDITVKQVQIPQAELITLRLTVFPYFCRFDRQKVIGIDAEFRHLVVAEHFDDLAVCDLFCAALSAKQAERRQNQSCDQDDIQNNRLCFSLLVLLILRRLM